MRVLSAAAMIALLAGPAFAQSKTPGPPPPPAKTRQEIEADRAAEKAYQNSLHSIPDQGPTDPWGNVRSDNAPKAAGKANAKTAPAKTPTKTGNTAN